MNRTREIIFMGIGILTGITLCGPAAQAATAITATLSSQPIYVNGQRVSMTAYHIGGSNYVRLRDIGQAVDFGVTYDAATNSVYIDPDSSYQEEVKQVAQTPTTPSAANPTEETVRSTIRALRDTYPTNTPYGAPYRSTSNGPYGAASSNCAGWAILCSDAAFGNLPWRRVDRPSWAQIRAGDLVEYADGTNHHVVVVLEKTDEYIKVTESGLNNKARWGGQYFKWWLEGQPSYILYQCNPSIADQEFLFSKRQYATITGRERKDNDVIAYHLRQSFKPGEITPELANKIGYDLAMSLTKGKHAFIVCTHVDKHHIHSHIVFNSTALDCTRKFRNFWRSSFAIRKISDMLCLGNGLSVIAEPKPSRGSYSTWLGEDKPPTVRGQLEGLIDTALGHGCKDFDSFLAAMKAAGVEVKRGKHLAFKIPNGKRFVRCDSLGDDYSEAAIMERIDRKRIVAPKAKAAAPTKPNMLIGIQARMQKINSPGFERWAKIFNLKEMAKTLIYLQEKGLTDFGELEKACDAASQKFSDLSDQIKAAEQRMKDTSELQRHIGTYSKTREVYAQYRKLTGRKQAKFYEQHSREIEDCKEAKRYFNSLGLKKLPSMQSLKQEYAALKAKKGKLYSAYKQTRDEMIELRTAKNNVDRILGATEKEKNRDRQQEAR